ncbi:MAG: ABC transporter substrate-binding protein [Bacilli bacterium]
MLDYGTLDTFDALGIKAKLAVPKNYMPSYLSKYKSSEYENIGGLKEFNLESINAFKPDLIVISARQQDYKNKLEEIAPVYFVKTSVAKDQLAETIKNIEFFGKLFGVPEKADLAIKDIRADVERTKRKAKENPLRTLVLIANDGKVSAFGSDRDSEWSMTH